jgi:CubicO group peptidase (beta-lactamase class C family)
LRAAINAHGTKPDVAPNVAPNVAQYAANYEYSNYGYAMLGRLLADASGSAPLGQPPITLSDRFMRELFEPLGMRASRLAVLPDDVRVLPTPAPQAGFDPLGQRVTPWQHQAASAGAAAMQASLGDLVIFSRAALNPPDDTWRAVFKLAFAEHGAAERGDTVGLGWHRRSSWSLAGGTRQVVWHAGATAGHRSLIIVDQAAQVAVIALSNREQNVSQLGWRVWAAANGDPAPETRIP